MKKSWILLVIIILAVSGCMANDPLYQYLKGIEVYNKGEYGEAVSYFERAAELDPQGGDKFRWLCYAYYEKGQYQKAVDAGKKAVNLPHSKEVEWQTWYSIGLAYAALGQIDSAISSKKRSIELKPDESDSFLGLSILYIRKKQYDEAITAAKRAIELKPDNAMAYNNLGAAYGMKKQYDEAIKALQKAIEIDPKMSDAYDWMGRFLLEQNAYNEAAEAYKKGIEAAPSFNHYPSLATAYYTMGRYDDALATINETIKLQTGPDGVGLIIDNKDNYPVVGGVVNTGPAKKADIQVGDKILKIDGESTKGWTEEKVFQNIRGTAGTQVVLTIERKGAEKTIDKTVTRETIITKEAAQSFGLRSFVYRYKGSLEAALKDAEKAYSLDSANDWAQVSLGASYLDQGKNDEAVKLLSQVKDSPTARILEATAYAKQGKTTEAVDIYLSIPEEEISSKNIPLMNDRMALLQTFKPIVKEHRDKAKSFQSQGQYKEALSELSEALKTADDTEVQDIQEIIFSMIRINPLLSEMPEDARKYVLRSELLTKEGNFEQAVTELKKAIKIAPYASQLYFNSALINAELKKYPEAIRYMNIYLKASPDALDARAAKDKIIEWEFVMEKGR